MAPTHLVGPWHDDAKPTQANLDRTLQDLDLMIEKVIGVSVAALAATGCSSAEVGPFGQDLTLLQKHTPIVVLTDDMGYAQVAVAPAWQGRVMTSTDAGHPGPSYGWINRELIESGETRPQINAYGGEDRFWMGPEGGQFSIFFAKGVPFEFEHWQTPAELDTKPFDIVSQTNDRVALRRKFQLENYSGTKFDVQVDREVRLLPKADVWKDLSVPPSDKVTVVGYESINRLTNAGTAAWQPETGLLSIWMLGMLNASPETTVVVPIREGAESDLGPRVNSDYFGAVPPERLVAEEKVVFFRGDGKYRSKIGVGPKRAKPVLGSYDSKNGVLTIVQFTLPQGATKYVNSQWKIQDDPFSGDAANSYSDDGKLGSFYEVESSSPAAELAPGQTLEHLHRTIHLRGSEADLEAIAQAMLGVGIDKIKTALPR
jgi:hypothetical protein